MAAFTFVMVFREGIETVLFLTALSATIGANPLNNLLGGAIGLSLAVHFGTVLATVLIRCWAKVAAFDMPGFDSVCERPSGK